MRFATTTMTTHRDHRRARELVRVMKVLFGVILLAVFLLATQLPSPSSDSSSSSLQGPQVLPLSASSSSKLLRLPSTKHRRIAIVIPFAAQGPESIPSYLNAFCAGASNVQDVADFLIFHNGVFDSTPSSTSARRTTTRSGRDGAPTPPWADCPTNVKFVSLGSTQQLAKLLLKVVLDFKDTSELAVETPQKLEQIVAKHVLVYPYSLVEFKPAYGYIFQDYLSSYTHWGYSDVDVVFGDLGRWMDAEEWYEYDVVTYGYGDQHRVYLRGQFTFHKNDPHSINQLWRSCDYLSNLDERLANALNGKNKYHFESAEGCYSVAMLQRTDLRVKYAVKAWTDVQQHQNEGASSLSGKHGLFLARNTANSRGIIYQEASDSTGSGSTDLLQLLPQWFEKDPIYKNRKLPLQKPIGELEEIALPNNLDAKCMYWVQSQYQKSLCLTEKVQHNENLYWIYGKLYKRRFEEVTLGFNVKTGPFFHFQEWKRYYRSSQLASLHLHAQSSSFILTKEGAIPLLDLSPSTRSRTRIIPSPLQRSLKKWQTVRRSDRSILPGSSYCLLSGPRKVPPRPAVPECYFQVSWHDDLGMEILSGAPEWSTVQVESDVTLVLTLQVTEVQAKNPTALSAILDVVVSNLSHWQGQPAVVLIHVAGATEDAIDVLRRRLQPDRDSSAIDPVGSELLDAALIAVIYHEEDITVSRKALLNMAADVVPTRWYVSGLELERGLVVSKDTAYFARRAARAYQKRPGHLFVLPQFALDREGGSTDLNLSELKEASVAGTIKAPAEVERSCDSDFAKDQSGRANALWWAQVEALLGGEGGESDVDVDLNKQAEWINAMELRLLESLTDEHHLSMFGLDESPILLTDTLGPRTGMRTDELVREVEQLGGRRCYNGLRLAQLVALGYRFDALGGAFAVSTDTTRGAMSWGIDDSAAGTSRCDGCFMFVDKHEDILEDIIKDEIVRAGKTAVIWDELDGLSPISS